MMAINHAVTGALLGATVHQPAAALPLAFLSHFLLDAVPHYDPVTGSKADVINSKKFFREQILINGTLCVALVLILAIDQPEYWLLMAVCAFLGASPDLMWVPRYFQVKRTGRDKPSRNGLLRFHSFIQWSTGPQFLWVELLWLAVSCGCLVYFLG